MTTEADASSERLPGLQLMHIQTNYIMHRRRAGACAAMLAFAQLHTQAHIRFKVFESRRQRSSMSSEVQMVHAQRPGKAINRFTRYLWTLSTH